MIQVPKETEEKKRRNEEVCRDSGSHSDPRFHPALGADSACARNFLSQHSECSKHNRRLRSQFEH